MWEQTWNFPVRVFDDFLLRLFEKYAELLKRRFSDDFQEVWSLLIIGSGLIYWQNQIVSTDDYMPMPIQTLEEYDKVLNVSWYSPEKPRGEQM